jgi:DNA-binding ferritin-like protein
MLKVLTLLSITSSLEIYTNEVYENTIDQTAEYVRTLDVYAPGSFERFGQSLVLLLDKQKMPRAMLMIQELLDDNNCNVRTY